MTSLHLVYHLNFGWSSVGQRWDNLSGADGGPSNGSWLVVCDSARHDWNSLMSCYNLVSVLLLPLVLLELKCILHN